MRYEYDLRIPVSNIREEKKRRVEVEVIGEGDTVALRVRTGYESMAKLVLTLNASGRLTIIDPRDITNHLFKIDIEEFLRSWREN